MNWPKEVKPLLHFLIALIQNPNLFFGLKFLHHIFSEAAAISLLNMCNVSLLLFHFLQRSANLTKRPVSFPITGTLESGTSGNVKTC